VKRRLKGTNSPMWEEKQEEPMNQICLKPW
jgi:hypothetical protein